jgi:hypothetical protein
MFEHQPVHGDVSVRPGGEWLVREHLEAGLFEQRAAVGDELSAGRDLFRRPWGWSKVAATSRPPGPSSRAASLKTRWRSGAIWAVKYPTGPRDFVVRDGAFSDRDAGGRVIVFRVRPVRGLGFHKGDRFSQTIWRRFP